jgi:hypothetical protein
MTMKRETIFSLAEQVGARLSYNGTWVTIQREGKKPVRVCGYKKAYHVLYGYKRRMKDV